MQPNRELKQHTSSNRRNKRAQMESVPIPTVQPITSRENKGIWECKIPRVTPTSTRQATEQQGK
jgi:hypothetical protein